jgi:hypothetical protein
MLRATLVGLIALPVAALPGTANAADGVSLTGGGQDFIGAQIAVSARLTPSGSVGVLNATLAASENNQPGAQQFRLRVVCLTVAGNVATIGAVPTGSAANDGPSFVVTVVDSGLPSGEGDLLGLRGGDSDCTRPAENIQPIEEGNFVVRPSES